MKANATAPAPTPSARSSRTSDCPRANVLVATSAARRAGASRPMIRPILGGRWPAAEEHGTRSLDRDRRHADDRHHPPGVGHARLHPTAQARDAAMIGTPAGAIGVSTSAIRRAEERGRARLGSIQVRHEQSEEQRRERGVQSQPSGVADQVSEQDARGRPDDPRRVQDEAAAHDELRSVPTAAVGGQRPRLVHDELRAQEPGPPRPRERRRHAHPDRPVAGVEEDRRRPRPPRGCRRC